MIGLVTPVMFDVLFYLDETTPKPCRTDADRLKANSQLGMGVALSTVGDCRVSTVFLGVNHSLDLEGPPLVFETMVFRGSSSDDLLCRRYATWHDALAGHQEIVAEWRENGAEP